MARTDTSTRVTASTPRSFAERGRGNLLLVTPVILAGLGAVYMWGHNPLSATAVLDGAYFLAALFSVGRIDRRVLGALLLLSTFLVVRLAIVAFGGSAGFEDTLQAHKWIAYLIGLSFFVGKPLDSSAKLVRLVKVLILLVAAKYFIANLVYGERYGILVENNFEIAMFCGLMGVVYSRLGPNRLAYLCVLGAAVLVSGSRSGSVVFLFLVIYALATSDVKNAFVRYVAFLTAAAAVIIPLLVFQSRTSSVDSIDRVNFLNVFLTEVQQWGVLTWMFGPGAMKPLSISSCEQLSYYVNLYSSPETGLCYSVILHAFVLRVVFDFGLAGLIIAFGVFWLLLRRGHVKLPLALLLMGIAAANSLSVSGLNNVYVVIPAAAALMLAARDREQNVPSPTPTQVPARGDLASARLHPATPANIGERLSELPIEKRRDK